jgi:hypothetical protein
LKYSSAEYAGEVLGSLLAVALNATVLSNARTELPR